jgi:hypothetical protein
VTLTPTKAGFCPLHSYTALDANPKTVVFLLLCLNILYLQVTDNLFVYASKSACAFVSSASACKENRPRCLKHKSFVGEQLRQPLPSNKLTFMLAAKNIIEGYSDMRGRPHYPHITRVPTTAGRGTQLLVCVDCSQARPPFHRRPRTSYEQVEQNYCSGNTSIIKARPLCNRCAAAQARSFRLLT